MAGGDLKVLMSSIPRKRPASVGSGLPAGHDIRYAFIGEAVGTYILVLFGTGSVAAAVATGAQMGLWQVAVVWAFGVALAIYATANVSGAHLNPAISLAFAIFRRSEFSARMLTLYWTAQLLGAILAGISVLVIFAPFIERFESVNGIVRGEDGSQRSAMMFGEYFPNPDVYGTGEAAAGLISPAGAAFVEGFGTAILALVIFSLTDRRNAGLSTKNMTPLLIGFHDPLIDRFYSGRAHQSVCAADTGRVESGPRLRAAHRRILCWMGQYRNPRPIQRILGVHSGANDRRARGSRDPRATDKARLAS